MKTIKLPRTEMISLLEGIVEDLKTYKNVKGHRTGFDEYVDKKYGGLHDFLLRWKQASAK